MPGSRNWWRCDVEPDDLLSLDLVLFSIGTGLKLTRYPSGDWGALATIREDKKVLGYGGRPWLAVQQALIESGRG